MRDPEVAPQTATRKLAVGNQWNAARRAWHAQRSIRKHGRSIGLVRLIVVRVLITEDVEWTA